LWQKNPGYPVKKWVLVTLNTHLQCGNLDSHDQYEYGGEFIREGMQKDSQVLAKM